MRNTLIFGLGLLLMIGLVSAMPDEIRYHNNLTGLPNAMVQVRNNDTANHLQDVWDKIQEKRLTQFSHLENLTAERMSDNSTEITGMGHAKFLGLFNMNKQYRFNVLENGTVTDRPRPLDFMWKKEV